MRSLRVVAPLGALAVLLSLSSCVGPAFVIVETALDNAVEGQAYETALDSDAPSSAVWRLTSGELPDGLTLSRAGLISGTPTESGVFTFSVRVDSNGVPTRTDQADFVLTVIPKLELTVSLSAAQVGIAYSATIAATGGVPPYAYGSVGLPAGLTFDGNAGVVSGTPLNPYDALQLQFTVTDSGSPQQYTADNTTLRIRPAPVEIITMSLADAAFGVYYSVTIEADEGMEPYSWAVTAGVLPHGLRLNTETGAITGIPTAVETNTFSVRVTDSDDPANVATRELTITVN